MDQAREKKIPKNYMVTVSYESGMVWLKSGPIVVPSATSADQEPYEISVDENGNLLCSCTGRFYRIKCRHEERAAYFLEYRQPKTPGQEAFWQASYNDRLRQKIRAGERPERDKRMLKSEAAHIEEREAALSW